MSTQISLTYPDGAELYLWYEVDTFSIYLTKLRTDDYLWDVMREQAEIDEPIGHIERYEWYPQGRG
jgi:hypothetical protein